MRQIVMLLCAVVGISGGVGHAHWRVVPEISTIDADEWAEASRFNRVWEDVTVSANAVTLDGDGKYRVTSCATPLQTINGTASGDVIVLSIDDSGCTSLLIEDGSGNIDLLADADITLTAATDFLVLVHQGSTLSAKQALSPCVSLGTVTTTATTYTIGDTATSELYGGKVYVTGATTLTVPAVSTLHTCVRFAVEVVGAVAVSLDMNTADRMLLNGVALSDGDKATSDGTAGRLLVCQYESVDGLSCVGDGWSDGGA